MALGQRSVLSGLRRLTVKAVADSELLRRFLEAQDATAFEAILQRHGPMVLGVCRRILNHGEDAEDAFQATFLILVQRGPSIQPPERVGAWLHGVALRTAQRARLLNLRRLAKERRAAKPEKHETDPDGELRALVDQVLHGLPEYYRDPILLCDLHGLTQREAARCLGWPEGTLVTRLGRGRKLLGKRLMQRGVGLGATALASLLADGASAQVPAALLSKTMTGAFAGKDMIGVAPVAAQLTREALQTMTMSKLRGLATGLLMLTLLIAGTAWALQGSTGVAKKSPETPAKEVKKALPERKEVDAEAQQRQWEKEVRDRLNKDAKRKALIEKHPLALIQSRYLYGAPDGAYRRSAYSFTFETSDPKVHRNDVHLLFHNGRDNRDRFEFNMGVDQRNIVVDLGPTDFYQDFDFLRQVLDTADDRDEDIRLAEIPAKEGHVYLQRVKMGRKGEVHYYVIFQVVAVDPDSRYMAFVWRKLPEASKVDDKSELHTKASLRR